MRIVLSDTCCFYALQQAAVLEEFVRLPYVVVVPLPLFEDKAVSLDDETRRRLMNVGLGVVNLTDAGVLKAMRYANKYRTLKIHDCFALAVAEDPGHSVLLTDDEFLTRVAHDHGLGTRGVLWATARIHQHERCSAGKLRDGLRTPRNDPRVFMPVESTRRPRRYR